MMEYFRISKEETIFIGDMPVDIQTAKSAGIDVCVVMWGYGHNDELEQLKPDFIAHSPHDLVPLIKE
jgi:phosphoglycolate phosphatase-like HAD superfamily hydrolase